MVKVDCFDNDTKRKRGLHRLRFGGIAKHLCVHLQVKAHAFGRERHGFTLACFLILANFRDKNLNGRFFTYVQFLLFMP